MLSRFPAAMLGFARSGSSPSSSSSSACFACAFFFFRSLRSARESSAWAPEVEGAAASSSSLSSSDSSSDSSSSSSSSSSSWLPALRRPRGLRQRVRRVSLGWRRLVGDVLVGGYGGAVLVENEVLAVGQGRGGSTRTNASARDDWDLPEAVVGCVRSRDDRR